MIRLLLVSNWLVNVIRGAVMRPECFFCPEFQTHNSRCPCFGDDLWYDEYCQQCARHRADAEEVHRQHPAIINFWAKCFGYCQNCYTFGTMEQKFSNNSIDLQVLREFCEREGEIVTYRKGEQMEREGDPARWFAFVTEGCFKYVTHGISDDKEHITWFSFDGEFVGDYPAALYGSPAQNTIEAMIPSRVFRVTGEQFVNWFRESSDRMELRCIIGELFLSQIKSRNLDHYRATARERYELLLRRCPGIVEHLPLNAIASFLCVTPQMLSKIRKDITFDTQL